MSRAEPELYTAARCPFAQRSRALVDLLGIRCRQVEVDLDDRGPAFLLQTPTGTVPLWVGPHGKVYESAQVNQYLAELHGWAEAWHQDVHLRARERLLMVRWDAVVVPAFYRTLRGDALEQGTEKELDAELAEMVQTVHALGGRGGGLPKLHCAPFWARMEWLRELSPIPEKIAERVLLRRWLDQAVDLPSIQKTLPDRDATVARYRARRS